MACTCLDMIHAVADEARQRPDLDRPAQLNYVAGQLAAIEWGMKPCPLQDTCPRYAAASQRTRQLRLPLIRVPVVARSRRANVTPIFGNDW